MILGPKDFRKELSLRWVFIFYNGSKPSGDIKTLMRKDYQKEVLNVRYPGYHYIFLERYPDYHEKEAGRIALSQNIIARCIPLKSDKYIALAAAQNDEDVTLDFFNEFMDFLVDNNRDRCMQLGINPDLSIDQIVKKYFPEELKMSEKDILQRMSSIFMSTEHLVLNAANDIAVKIEPNLKGVVGTPYEHVSRRDDEGDWIVNVYADGNAYEIALKGRVLFRKAMFLYMLLHPNERFDRKTFDEKSCGEKEIGAIIESLYASSPLINQEQEVNYMFNTHFRGEEGANFSRNMRKINTVINTDGNLFVDLPFSWIKNTTQNGVQGVWVFDKPEKVTIYAEDFKKEVKKRMNVE